jgi:hypothetical protein
VYPSADGRGIFFYLFFIRVLYIYEKVLYLHIQKQETMTIFNQTKSKAVYIRTENSGQVRASFVQIYNGEESLVLMKSFASIKTATKWAAKIIN